MLTPLMQVWIWVVLIGTAIVSYLIGSVNSSIIISRFLGADIREHGSGNAGATNMLRTYGKRMGALALVGDVLKGVIAVGLGMLAEHLLRAWLFGAGWAVSMGFIGSGISATLLCWYALLSIKYLAGIAVVLGHNYPVFFGFRGGKGIATSAAVIIMLDWRAGLITLAVALLIMAATRYVSLGSVIAGVIYPVCVAIFTFGVDKQNNVIMFATSLILGGAAIYRHKANIKRLLKGTEHKIGQKSKVQDEKNTDSE